MRASTQVTKIFRFEAAHSVSEAFTSRCDRLRGGMHGHSYVVEVTLEGGVRADGMVMDFTLLKQMFNHIIDAFDHTYIVNDEDKVMVKLIPHLSSRYILFPGNPTAENMARYFFKYISNALPTDPCVPPCLLHSITVWETTTGKATQPKMFNGLTPPRMKVSANIASDWTEKERETFTNNMGIVLEPEYLITEDDVKDIDWAEGSGSGRALMLTVKNCK